MSEQVTNNSSNQNSGQTRKRIPLGTRNILTAPQRPGFVRRFVNDTGDRVQMFKDAGWNAVDDGTTAGDPKIGRPTNIGSATNPSVGNNQRAILMEIPEEIYKADQAESQAKITAVENQIKRNSKSEGKDGLSGSVTIS